MDRKPNPAIPPSPAGIVHCLRLLAEEATTLGLPQSAVCIREAVEIVAIEVSFHAERNIPILPGFEPEETPAQPALPLH